jgi:hypothetical protein
MKPSGTVAWAKFSSTTRKTSRRRGRCLNGCVARVLLSTVSVRGSNRIAEVSADKGYVSKSNAEMVASVGANGKSPAEMSLKVRLGSANSCT